MNQTNRRALAVVLLSASALTGMTVSAVRAHAATTVLTAPSPRITEDDPRWNCATMGNRVCGSGPIRIAAARLATRPSLVKPGAWVAPAGSVLVKECFDSYPYPARNPRHSELFACLTQPDPRLTDPSVITAHAAHVLHLLHAARTR